MPQDADTNSHGEWILCFIEFQLENAPSAFRASRVTCFPYINLKAWNSQSLLAFPTLKKSIFQVSKSRPNLAVGRSLRLENVSKSANPVGMRLNKPWWEEGTPHSECFSDLTSPNLTPPQHHLVKKCSWLPVYPWWKLDLSCLHVLLAPAQPWGTKCRQIHFTEKSKSVAQNPGLMWKYENALSGSNPRCLRFQFPYKVRLDILVFHVAKIMAASWNGVMHGLKLWKHRQHVIISLTLSSSIQKFPSFPSKVLGTRVCKCWKLPGKERKPWRRSRTSFHWLWSRGRANGFPRLNHCSWNGFWQTTCGI